MLKQFYIFFSSLLNFFIYVKENEKNLFRVNRVADGR